jgi:type VI secretion system protein ImpH
VASQERSSADLLDVVAALRADPGQLSFVPLVALLERLLPGGVRVGGDGPVSEESIRFRHDPSLTFSAGDVRQVRLGSDRRAGPDEATLSFRPVAEVLTTFLGLTGAVSPLPGYIAEEVAQEEPDRPVRREFLDLFHHRLLSLLYRVLSRYSLEAESTAAGDDVWSKRVLALAGLDTYESGPKGLLSAARLLRLAPLLATRARTAGTLERALTDVLREELGEARVSVRQFVGGWMELESEHRFRLGHSNSNLGRSSLLGGKLFDRAGKFRIVFSPLDGVTYHRLLPEGDLNPLVREVVDLVLKAPLDCELELGVREEALGKLRLSSREPMRLGRETYLGTRSSAAPRLQTRICPLPPASVPHSSESLVA